MDVDVHQLQLHGPMEGVLALCVCDELACKHMQLTVWIHVNAITNLKLKYENTSLFANTIDAAGWCPGGRTRVKPGQGGASQRQTGRGLHRSVEAQAKLVQTVLTCNQDVGSTVEDC
jgi:hypothetical protein